MPGGRVLSAAEVKTDIYERVQAAYDGATVQKEPLYRNLLMALSTATVVKVESRQEYDARKRGGDKELSNALRGERNRLAIVDPKKGVVLHLLSGDFKEGKFLEIVLDV